MCAFRGDVDGNRDGRSEDVPHDGACGVEGAARCVEADDYERGGVFFCAPEGAGDEARGNFVYRPVKLDDYHALARVLGVGGPLAC